MAASRTGSMCGFRIAPDCQLRELHSSTGVSVSRDRMCLVQISSSSWSSSPVRCIPSRMASACDPYGADECDRVGDQSNEGRPVNPTAHRSAFVRLIQLSQYSPTFVGPSICRRYRCWSASRLGARPPVNSYSASSASTATIASTSDIASGDKSSRSVTTFELEAVASEQCRRTDSNSDVLRQTTQSLSLRAATKASWGTSTRPMDFIFFLPSFCFSSSLRLRVMSPP
jgi:hypothetical protein